MPLWQLYFYIFGEKTRGLVVFKIMLLLQLKNICVFNVFAAVYILYMYIYGNNFTSVSIIL
jgi:hypothetical protein